MVSTTIAAGSNTQTLPQAIINVASVTGFAASGTFNINTSTGVSQVAYSGTSGGNQFTGCTGGTGTMSTNGFVSQSTSNTTGLIFKRYENSISPAVTSTDQTLNVGSSYSINHGWSNVNTNDASGTPHGVDLPGQFFETWPLRSSLSGILSVYGLTSYYQMTGFYVIGGVLESFVSIGGPTAATAINPATGHTLVRTFVGSFWQV